MQIFLDIIFHDLESKKYKKNKRLYTPVIDNQKQIRERFSKNSLDWIQEKKRK
jgi:hypothetical protein